MRAFGQWQRMEDYALLVRYSPDNNCSDAMFILSHRVSLDYVPILSVHDLVGFFSSMYKNKCDWDVFSQGIFIWPCNRKWYNVYKCSTIRAAAGCQLVTLNPLSVTHSIISINIIILYSNFSWRQLFLKGSFTQVNSFSLIFNKNMIIFSSSHFKG